MTTTLMPPKRTGSSDIFQTPAWPVLSLLPYIPIEWKIWEPACGKGQLVNTLLSAGYETIGTDIQDGFDFLDDLSAIGRDFDCIITNPPYSTKDKWLTRCFEIGKPFALLLPITALGEQYRVQLYRQHGIQIVLLPERVHFETPTGEGKGAWFYTAWFCNGLDLPNQITVAEDRV